MTSAATAGTCEDRSVLRLACSPETLLQQFLDGVQPDPVVGWDQHLARSS
jgi:hypothetical protein